MGRQSYLIALGGNRAKSRAAIGALVAPAEAGAAFGKRALQLQPAPAFAGATVVVASGIHTTPPLGPGKRHYANAVALIETDLDPPALLAWLKAIERAHGRRAGRRWGDRPLDLDLIGWSGGVWTSRTLSIPHPAFRTRRFVLAPLVEIAPGWRDPRSTLTARQLLARLDRKRPRA